MDGLPNHEHHSLVYPNGLCEPKELLGFVQLEPYSEAFQSLELTDDEQRTIEIAIMMDPTICPIIEGTGGVREFQFGTPSNSAGSLHLSAFYAYFPESRMVALISLVQTDEIGEFTPEERKEVKGLFEDIQEELAG